MRSGPRCWVRILVVASVTEVAVLADWTPPENPDPQKIREEAGVDTKAGRYADALTKLTWFHENALTTPGGEGLSAVRLSFALKDWDDLARKYPPALRKLVSYRDDAMQRVREGKDAFASFQEAKRINEVLNEDKRTHELFLWLDANKTEVAKQVYALAEPLLVSAKQYKLCGAYLDRPEKRFERTASGFRMGMKFGYTRIMTDFQEKNFANDVATLVALLTVNNRKEEAEKIAAAAGKEWNETVPANFGHRVDPEFAKQLGAALSGIVPEPWPPPMRFLKEPE